VSIVTGSASAEQLQATARDHLWSHFANLAAFQDHEIPVIVSGEGCCVTDANGKRYVDGLSGLFASQLGYSHGEEMGEAAAAQMRELGYYPNWAQAHPRVVELAGELASLAPEGLNRSFFVSGGAEAVESAWKLARQYWTAKGERRYKVIARRYAYHGTTMGALSINGIPGLRAPWEPLVPGVSHVWNTDRFHRPQDETEEEFTRFLLTDLEQALIQASPASVAMVIMEPVQNQGGSLLPPEGYWAGVRELCDRYDVLLCADEVITGFGRLGAWFGSDLYDIRPDIVTCAKGLASGYAPIGAVIASDRLAEPFLEGGGVFTHGFTYGGHPVSCAVALKSVEIMRRERVVEHVRDNQDALRSTLERLLELPIVGDVRGTGYFFTIELTKDRDTRATMTLPEREHLFRGYLAPALFEHGLICRAEERIAPLIQISPPLVAGQEEFDRITEILTHVLREAPQHLPS
jgi:adenosylmethionine-8-amino-7-oxononanoate aminotransferase